MGKATQKNLCFNSTLVQLKGLLNNGSLFRLVCFNSTLVQLKVNLTCLDSAVSRVSILP